MKPGSFRRNTARLLALSQLVLPLLSAPPAQAFSWANAIDSWIGPQAKVPPRIVHSCVARPQEEKVRSFSFPRGKAAPQYAPPPASPAPMKSGASEASRSLAAPLAESAPPPPVGALFDKKEAVADYGRRDESEGPGDAKDKLDLHQAGKKVGSEIRRASELYLSNDDSMSLASAQRLIYAIDNFLPIYRDEIRPHELLNFFHFKTAPLASGSSFSVKMEAAPREKGETLAISVQGKKLSLEQRRPAVLTFVVDKSGSMAAQGKMEYLKEGLKILRSQLKPGDVVNVVEFDHEVCNAMEGMLVGRDDWKGYETTVDELAPRGSTNLHEGLVEGYKLAEKFHDPRKINRVILVTDAIANTGELSPELMASIGKYYDTKKIALSGIGVGLEFNDELLDTLTDKGKGAYLFLGMKEALPRVFGSEFTSLLETVARDVRFKATFPKGLHLDVFYGEEVSTDREKIQPIHYFANTAQLFLLDLLGRAEEGGKLGLQIEYSDPVTDEAKVENFSVAFDELKGASQQNIAKARRIMAFAQLLEETALPGARPMSGWNQRYTTAGVSDSEAKGKCAKTLAEMKGLNAIYSDKESQEVSDLANKYCARF
jgi:Ca-activated chloride channel family protein